MTATIIEFPMCRFDREFILTGQTIWTRALDEAEAIGVALQIGHRGVGINARISALTAIVAGLAATRPDDVETEVYLSPVVGMEIALSLRGAPAFLRAMAAPVEIELSASRNPAA